MLRAPKLFTLFLMVGLASLNACKGPSSPDFSTEHSLDIPLFNNQKIIVMGRSMALIDTTNQDGFDTLFTKDPDGLVSISSDMEFDFGDFGDAIPEIEINKISIDTEIGSIEVDDFSSDFSSEIGVLSIESESTGAEEAQIGVFDVSFEGSGSSSFEDVTGVPNTSASIPAGDASIFIDLDAGAFQSAIVESGGISVTFTNNLGFDISSIEASLQADGIAVGSTLLMNDVQSGDVESGVIAFNNGDVIEGDLKIKVDLEWEADNITNPGDLEVEAGDEDLVVKEAVSDIPAQVLDPSSPSLEIDNPTFEYALVEDADNLVAGENDITIEIINNTGLPMTNSAMNGMPELTLFNSKGEVLDSKKTLNNISSPGAGSLGSNQTGKVTFDLRNEELTRDLSFNLDAGTSGGSGLTVNSEDFFSISSTTGNLNFTEAKSDVEPQDGIKLEDTASVEGDFVNAQVKEGELILTFTNETEIPLVIDELNIFNKNAFVAKNTSRTFSSGSEIGEITNVIIPAGETKVEIIDITGKGISNEISYTGTASSPGTNEAVTIQSADLINIHLDGSILLNSATAVLKAQEFTEAGDIEIDDEFFTLENGNHYVQLKSGDLRIVDVVNEIDLDLESLEISFPEIRTGMYQPEDSLVITLTGSDRIRRSSTIDNAYTVSLEGARIYAPGNTLKYNVLAATENTANHPQGDSIRTVNATDKILASVEIQDLLIGFAKGMVKARTILLNDDDPSNGEDVLDLFTDNEVQTTKMDGLDMLSGSELSFYEPSLNLFYDTNLGVSATIYAAILGVNENNEQVYLSGNSGSTLEVINSDNVSGLMADGLPIPPEKLVKFTIDKNTSGGNVSSVIVFDNTNSNIEDFFSNLPEDIRFIGKAVVNEGSGEGEISDPIEFITSMGVDIPLNFATKGPAVFEDTLSVDLADLPDGSGDNKLSNSSLHIEYENGMPFDVDLSLEFLDSDLNVITRVPDSSNPSDQKIQITAAPVHSETRFTSSSNTGTIEISLTRQQLENLYQTRQLILIGDFQTSSQEQVKLRSDDFIDLSVFGKFKVENRFGD